MLYTIRWPKTPAITRIFVWIFIFKIGWDIAIQNFNFVCCLVPSDFNPGLHKSVHKKTRSWTMFSETLSKIDAVLTEIRHFEFDLVVLSAHHSVAYEHIAFCPSAFSQKSFSRPNEATVELPDCIERFLVPFGTFCKWFNCQKATISFTHYASNCPGSTYGVFTPG